MPRDLGQNNRRLGPEAWRPQLNYLLEVESWPMSGVSKIESGQHLDLSQEAQVLSEAFVHCSQARKPFLVLTGGLADLVDTLSVGSGTGEGMSDSGRRCR